MNILYDEGKIEAYDHVEWELRSFFKIYVLHLLSGSKNDAQINYAARRSMCISFLQSENFGGNGSLE
jgi:hypothetical protein